MVRGGVAGGLSHAVRGLCGLNSLASAKGGSSWASLSVCPHVGQEGRGRDGSSILSGVKHQKWSQIPFYNI